MTDFQISDGAAVKIVQAVVAECERCGTRSRPIDPKEVTEWTKAHMVKHSQEDLIAYWAEHGHKIGEVVEWMDQDDSSGYGTCSCGWRSRAAKTCWSHHAAVNHLRELVKVEEQKPPEKQEKRCYCGKPESVCIQESGSNCHHPHAHAHMWGD
jgi:hypothetical protein